MHLIPRDLPDNCRGMFLRHGTYALLDSAAAGILMNAPAMALLSLGADNWKLSFQLAVSSLGMFLALILGGVMARRRKKPFVLAPGLLMTVSTAAMTLADTPTVFLLLLGLVSLFDVALRPALTAIVRLNYPASHRGLATGRIRAACSVVFMVFGLGSSLFMEWAGEDARWMIQTQMLIAAALMLLGFLVLWGLQVNTEVCPEPPVSPRKSWSEAMAATTNGLRNTRFRRYLGIGFLYAFGGLLYVSFIPSLLKDDLQLGYMGISLLTHILPSLLALLSTSALGGLADRVNPWKAWALIRLGWGLDPLLLALAALTASTPIAALGLTLLGRASRGLVMGGSWILWWQVGLHHFAPPGGDTTRYMGLLMFVNGLSRLLGPLAGAWLLHTAGTSALLAIGAFFVLGSSFLSWREARLEANNTQLQTIASFERSFPG